MDDSMGETATSSSTTTSMEGVTDRSSTYGKTMEIILLEATAGSFVCYYIV